jgi:hypothetical protein
LDAGRSLTKLGTFVKLRDGNVFSDLALAVESERWRLFGPTGSKAGARGRLSSLAGPKPLSGDVLGSSSFSRRRRSDDRTVIVEGTLLNILFVGVSYPQAAFAVVNVAEGPSPILGLTGVTLPLLAGFVCVLLLLRGVPIVGAAGALSRLGPLRLVSGERTIALVSRWWLAHSRKNYRTRRRIKNGPWRRGTGDEAKAEVAFKIGAVPTPEGLSGLIPPCFKWN